MIVNYFFSVYFVNKISLLAMIAFSTVAEQLNSPPNSNEGMPKRTLNPSSDPR